MASIENSHIYRTVTPLVLISLGSLYISILLFRYVSWRFRRRRARQTRKHRQQLEKFWRKYTLMLEMKGIDTIQLPLQTYHSDKKKNIPHSFYSSATLVGLSRSSLHSDLVEEQQCKTRHTKSSTTEHQSNESLKQRRFSVVARKMDSKRQQKKRRQLLWQWGVAMGYCTYEHGHRLDTMINKLLEKENGNSN